MPQGTPTSSYLANIVELGFDEKLLEVCNENNITYNRYVDDLTFSVKQDFQELIMRFIGSIKEKLSVLIVKNKAEAQSKKSKQKSSFETGFLLFPFHQLL